MAWECVVKGKELADVRRDRRGSKSIEKYNVSEQAVYFEAYYLPIAAIQSVRVQPSVYRPNHSCGRGLPVFKVRILARQIVSDQRIQGDAQRGKAGEDAEY